MSETIPSFPRRLWALIRPYWTSEERWMARLLFGVIIAFNLGEVYLTVLLNGWNNDFYNALQNLDKPGFFHALFRFSYLALTFILLITYEAYLTQMLHIKWRRWMTDRYLDCWLRHQNYYRMQLLGEPADNPDQRISEDIDQFIRISLILFVGGLNKVVTLFSFFGILWALSGSLDFAFAGREWHIPGYMVFAAILYSVIGTWATFRIGGPLIRLTFDQQHFEANFRFHLVRLRENTESIAFYKGESQEKQGFVRRFSDIVGNWRQIMLRRLKLTGLLQGFGQLAEVFPFLMAAPRYFAGSIKLGGLMQIASAFSRVQDALSYLINVFSIDSTTGIANWKAVADRLIGFNRSIAHAEAMHAPAELFIGTPSPDTTLGATDLTLFLPDGKPLLSGIHLAIRPGDTLLITGRSGSGKSTLLRALAGLWPFVEGTLAIPERARLLFVPQKSYLPLGTLAQSLCYPGSADVPEGDLQAMLSLCGLGALSARLGDTEQWSNVLSLGEQQRVAFARVLLARPDFVFLDEATSALDEPSEAHLYGLLKIRLPNSAVVSVGHRATLRAWHSSAIALGE